MSDSFAVVCGLATWASGGPPTLARQAARSSPHEIFCRGQMKAKAQTLVLWPGELRKDGGGLAPCSYSFHSFTHPFIHSLLGTNTELGCMS